MKTINPQKIYDILPFSQRTLLKRYKNYEFKIDNALTGSCDWWIYDKQELPIAVVLYRSGRKLCLHLYNNTLTE